MISKFQRFLQNRVVQHTLFWLFSYYVLLRAFSGGDILNSIDAVYTLVFHLPIVLSVYLNLLWIIPAYLQKNRYTAFSLLSILNILTFSAFNIILFRYIVDWVVPGYYFISYYTLWEMIQFTTVYIALTSLLKWSKAWFVLKEAEGRLVQADKSRKEAELKALRSQLDPHFLFNTLNNIYSMVVNKHERAEDAILRLSDATRYILYETATELVPVSKEIDFLDQYFELQRMRTGDQGRITWNKNIAEKDLEIAPLLLLPLVENAFKHGLEKDPQNGFVEAGLEITDSNLIFKIVNNQGSESKGSGIGIENLRTRLDLIYPGRYSLQIEENEKFKVALSIRL